MHLNLVRALGAVIRHNGPRPAMLDVARTYTWTEFGERVGRAAGALRGLGVAKGARFAVLARNGFRQEELKWAGFRLGTVPVLTGLGRSSLPCHRSISGKSPDMGTLPASSR